MLHLDPDTYLCPTHGHELRSLIEEALDEQGLPAAYNRRKRCPFEVIVACPGSGDAHRQAFTGRFWR